MYRIRATVYRHYRIQHKTLIEDTHTDVCSVYARTRTHDVRNAQPRIRTSSMRMREYTHGYEYAHIHTRIYNIVHSDRCMNNRP